MNIRRFFVFFPWVESINKNIHGSRESMVDSDFLDVCALPIFKENIDLLGFNTVITLFMSNFINHLRVNLGYI